VIERAEGRLAAAEEGTCPQLRGRHRPGGHAGEEVAGRITAKRLMLAARIAGYAGYAEPELPSAVAAVKKDRRVVQHRVRRRGTKMR